MGSLTPGATYIYERSNGKIYAREMGKAERTVIGYETNKDVQNNLFNMWNDILLEAEHNPSLQHALENAIMIYRLSKDNPL